MATAFAVVTLKYALPVVLASLFVTAVLAGCGGEGKQDGPPSTGPVAARQLPAPDYGGGSPLNRALDERTSVSKYAPRSLTPTELASLLWAAYGVQAVDRRTDSVTGATRTVPSAGAIYPLDFFVLEGSRLERYLPDSNSLLTVSGSVDRSGFAHATGQEFVGMAPAVIVITADIGKSANKYGSRAERYCLLEAGHAAENILLEAVSLGLAGVPVGAFDEAAVKEALGMKGDSSVMYLVTLGERAR